MLGALSDGRRWSTLELAVLGMTPHSRKSDLKKLGYTVEVSRTSTAAGEKDVYFYRLLAVPPSRVLPFEDGLDAEAAEALRRMRFAGQVTRVGDSTLHTESGPVEPATVAPALELGGRGRGSSRAGVDRDNEAAPVVGAPAGGGSAPSSAALPFGERDAPPGAGVLPDEGLLVELAGLEDEIATLSADVMSLEDDERLRELADRRDEIYRLLFSRAAA